MRHHHTGSRPHARGSGKAPRVRHGARDLTGGGGLVLVRKPFDRLALAGWIDGRAKKEKDFFRPGLMSEVWIVPPLYGGGVMDDPPLLERRGVRRIFGWRRVPDPTTFGRWLRRAGTAMVPLLDESPWRMVRRRWALAAGVPKRPALVMDSTVVVRYGLKQAGAERGYNPKKRGRPSHHPLPAFVRETGDCLGVRWRPGAAHTAGGAAEWLGELVARPRGAGVEEVTVRPGKGFFSRKMARTLEELGVSFPLKVPRHGWLRGHRSAWRFSAKDEAVFPGEEPWTTTGELQGARLLSVRTTRPLDTRDTLDLDTYEVIRQAGVLTNIAGIHAPTAWRLHDRGAVVERRIEELAQLSAGETAVDDTGGDAPPWSLAVVAHQTPRTPRENFLSGSWRTAQPKRLRLRPFRLPAKLTTHARKTHRRAGGVRDGEPVTTHARKTHLQLLRGEPVRLRLLAAPRALNHAIPPPATA